MNLALTLCGLWDISVFELTGGLTARISGLGLRVGSSLTLFYVY